jgi:plastocyanin
MRPSKLLLPLLVAVISMGVLTACGSSTKASSSPTTASGSPSGSSGAVTGATITIKNFAFSPSTLTVTPGSKVTVHNEDSATHTVTSVSTGFNTGDLAPGGTMSFTAPSTAGSYPYICQIHQFMHGTLVVS